MPVAMYRLMVGDDQPLHVWTWIIIIGLVTLTITM